MSNRGKILPLLIVTAIMTSLFTENIVLGKTVFSYSDIELINKKKVTFNITSDTEGKSVEGAVLTIGNDEYTVPASGKVEAYYLSGDYDYSIKLAKHKSQTGTFTVLNESIKVLTGEFIGIDSVTDATLIHAVYNSSTNVLENIDVDKVAVTDGKYSFTSDVESEGKEHKYFLWDANGLNSMKPLSKIAQITETELTNDNNIELEYEGNSAAAAVELSGGEAYIYLPTSGTTSSKAFTATVYDKSGLAMDADVEWTLPNQPDTISVENGVVTVMPNYPIADDNGADVIVRATVEGTHISNDTKIHIRNTARATTWDIVGPAVIKDKTAATYSVANVKDQYGNDYTAEETYTLTSTSNAQINGLSITPDVGTAKTEEVTLTTTLSGSATAYDKTVTVYGYDFYEPGIGEATYCAPRMEDVNGVSTMVWPKAGGTTEITLPKAVLLTPESTKIITFDNMGIGQHIGCYERSMKLINSAGDNVIDIDFANPYVFMDYIQSSERAVFVGTEIGEMEDVGIPSSAEFILKTNADGVTSAILSYNGSALDEYTIGDVTDIAKIKLTTGEGLPDDRLLTLTNFIITDYSNTNSIN